MPPLTRTLLIPAAIAYSAVVRLRNRRYDGVLGATVRAGIPVISVGNVTVGGTGKTPMVIEIARTLRRIRRTAAIVTRGYRGAPGRPADEVLEFQAALPDVPVVVDPDRVAGVATAQRVYAADCAVLDDAFQHRRIERDLDVVLIDALDPWGGGWTLPAGRLREPLAGLKRARLLVITRANQASPDEVAEIERRLYQLAPGAAVFHADVLPQALVDLDEHADSPEQLAFHNVLPVCGLGNPGSFLRTVEPLAGRVCPPRLYDDHHAYELADVDGLARFAENCGADLVVTSRKDWVKLAPLWRQRGPAGLPLARLDIRSTIARQRDEFESLVLRAVEERR